MKSRRVSPIGWVGLGLGILFPIFVVTTLWLFLEDRSDGEGHPMSSVAFLWPWSLLVGCVDFAGAIIVNNVAGDHGAGNRLMGIFGGVILLASPVAVVVAVVAASSLPGFGG